jgi:hypothetical protein
MKKFRYLRKRAFLFCLVLALSIFSCSDEGPKDIQTTIVDVTLPEDLGGINLGPFIAPAGTKAIITNQGGTLRYELPDDYVYAGLNEGGDLVMLTAGCYECSSPCSSGCDVVKLGDTVGCSTCDKNSTGDKTCTGKPCDIIYSLNNGGLLDLQAGISIVKDTDEAKKLRADMPTYEVLSKIPDVEAEIIRFIEDAWKGEEFIEENGSLVLVNFFGARALMLVPNKKVSGSSLRTEGTSCNCTSGTSGCDYEGIYKGLIKVGETCRANGCTTCQMKFDDPKE